ncbi:hypothetical protein [Nonomuraea candida]|uniref:hypothetical protein n=1 Tax=Nonomuraea candida TaxID=359159 RepID=UPI0005BCD82D|nr:hypothetical protein [Nonomuraea candida]
MTTSQDLTDQAHPAAPPEDTAPPAATTPEATAAEDAAPEDAVRSGDATPPPDAAAPETAAPGPDGPKPPATQAEEAGEAEAGRLRGAAGVRRAKVLGALAAMLVTALAATAVLQWMAAARAQDAGARLESERALRLEVSGAAAAFSRALLGYDYRSLQSSRSALAAQATGDFLATYDAAFGGAMAQVIVKLKATAQATVREVYVADVDEATARAIVVVDQQVNTSEAIRSVKDSHLKISLVKEKGTWKIHDVTVLGAASEDQYNLNGDDEKKKD